QRRVEIRVAVARKDDPVGAVGHEVARLGIRRALAGGVIKREGRDQPAVGQEPQVVREYRDAVDSVTAQDMPYERHKAVADNVDADLPQLRPFDDLGKSGIDAHSRQILEQPLAGYAHVLDLQPQAIPGRKMPLLPGIFPIAPRLVRRVPLDQLVENVALHERVVEVEKQHWLKQRSWHAPAPPLATRSSAGRESRRISADGPPPSIAPDRRTPGGRTA